jgi:hypothetical protein
VCHSSTRISRLHLPILLINSNTYRYVRLWTWQTHMIRIPLINIGIITIERFRRTMWFVCIVFEWLRWQTSTMNSNDNDLSESIYFDHECMRWIAQILHTTDVRWLLTYIGYVRKCYALGTTSSLNKRYEWDMYFYLKCSIIIIVVIDMTEIIVYDIAND